MTLIALLMTSAAEAKGHAYCQHGMIANEWIEYWSPAQLLDQEIEDAAATLREPGPTPENGMIYVVIWRQELEAARGEHFVIAFGDATRPSELDRHPQEPSFPRASPGSPWNNTFLIELPVGQTTVHVLDEYGSKRCSATIDAKGKIKRISAALS